MAIYNPETKAQVMEGVENVESSKVVAHSTVEYFQNGVKKIRYHHTDIITFNSNGSITLNSGGWKTPSTKERMNKFLPKSIIVHQENDIWYVIAGGHDRWVGGRHTFEDGITINTNYSVKGAGVSTDKLLKLKNRINRYVKEYMVRLSNRELPAPSAGDCWICLNPKLMAESNDYHLLSHIDENYFVPSLIFNVIKEFPLGDLPMCQVAYWFRKTEESIPSLNTYVKKQVKRNFVRYMYKHLGFSS